MICCLLGVEDENVSNNGFSMSLNECELREGNPSINDKPLLFHISEKRYFAKCYCLCVDDWSNFDQFSQLYRDVEQYVLTQHYHRRHNYQRWLLLPSLSSYEHCCADKWPGQIMSSPKNIIKITTSSNICQIRHKEVVIMKW